MEHRYETPGRLELGLRLGSSDAEIGAGEAGVTLIELRGGDPDAVVVELSDLSDGGHLLTVEQRGARGGRSGSKIHVTAPEGVHLRAESGSGDVTARLRLGSLTHRSGSGDLSFADVAGDAMVRAASGAVRGRGVDGDVNVESASGDVELGDVGGSLTAHLASGDLRVRHVAGSVKVSSASGDVTLGAIGAGTAAITSMSGDLSVAVRPGVTAWLDLSSVSGDASSELDPSGAAGEGATLELRASSVSGDVRVTRARS